MSGHPYLSHLTDDELLALHCEAVELAGDTSFSDPLEIAPNLIQLHATLLSGNTDYGRYDRLHMVADWVRTEYMDRIVDRQPDDS